MPSRLLLVQTLSHQQQLPEQAGLNRGNMFAMQISLDCWNCWANMLANSKSMKDYQTSIKNCALGGQFMYYLGVLLLMILVA
jgi:hypothetical protein